MRKLIVLFSLIGFIPVTESLNRLQLPNQFVGDLNYSNETDVQQLDMHKYHPKPVGDHNKKVKIQVKTLMSILDSSWLRLDDVYKILDKQTKQQETFLQSSIDHKYSPSEKIPLNCCKNEQGTFLSYYEAPDPLCCTVRCVPATTMENLSERLSNCDCCRRQSRRIYKIRKRRRCCSLNPSNRYCYPYC